MPDSKNDSIHHERSPMTDPQTPSQPLTNSQRRLYKATYRPLAVPPPPPQEEGRGRFLEKLAFLRGLNIQPQELARLEADAAAQGRASTTDTHGAGALRVIDIIKGLATDFSFAAMRRYGPLLADLRPEELIGFANALAEMRRAAAIDVRAKLRELQDRYSQALGSAASSGTTSATAAGPISIEAAMTRAKG
jgi:hypothetical protein